ncbi:MAG: TolC family protein [Cyclobacteriaceae bacterium]|nr:TolC family protein [Cyclobacteriaceae bacterium]
MIRRNNLTGTGRRMRALLSTGILFLLSLSSTSARCQSALDAVFMLPDSVLTMSLDEFYGIILAYHPVVKQASLLNSVAQQEIRLARGNFDPKVNTQWNLKELDDKSYYNKLNAYIAIPTWFPVNPKVGVEQNEGVYLNPENFITSERQYYAGVSIPIGRGLFTDERRAAVKQAELFQDIAIAEQVKVVNKILLQAAKDYWQWYYTYYQYRLMNRSVEIAEEIFRRVKLNAALGEASVIDTVQAKIILQTRLVEQQEAILAFQNAGIILSNYLWSEQREPLQLSNSIAPVLGEADGQLLRTSYLEELLMQARENHPELLKLKVKLEQLEVERRLASEFLKPQLDLNYTALSQPSGGWDMDLTNNYKFGLDFSFPIFLRKERSKVALTKLKIQHTTFEQQQTQREILNEVNRAFNELTNTNTIVQQQSEMANLYDRLLQAELLNLENGESDLFKISIQQEKLIQAQTKVLKLKAEYEKQKALLFWAAGLRNLKTEN